MVSSSRQCETLKYVVGAILSSPVLEGKNIINRDSLYDANSLCIYVCALAAFVCWVASSSTGNHSQVDKLWSIMPVIYSWLCVVDTRTFVMAWLATIWGVRLTYNFYRRGGYSGKYPWEGDEDYRWVVLKGQSKYQVPYFTKWLSKPNLMAIFNFVFISIYQHLLLLLIASPCLVAWNASVYCMTQSSSFSVIDGVAVFLILGFLLIETLADQQQYNFQSDKQKAQDSGLLLEPFAKGFCTSGLFSYVRKPNYAAEQGIWVSFYLFSVTPSSWLNWSLAGCVQLIILFQGSAWVTEAITQQKYPEYNVYIQNVPLYLPAIKPLGQKCHVNKVE